MTSAENVTTTEQVTPTQAYTPPTFIPVEERKTAVQVISEIDDYNDQLAKSMGRRHIRWNPSRPQAA